jgi:hypothetical protein
MIHRRFGEQPIVSAVMADFNAGNRELTEKLLVSAGRERRAAIDARIVRPAGSSDKDRASTTSRRHRRRSPGPRCMRAGDGQQRRLDPSFPVVATAPGRVMTAISSNTIAISSMKMESGMSGRQESADDAV